MCCNGELEPLTKDPKGFKILFDKFQQMNSILYAIIIEVLFGDNFYRRKAANAWACTVTIISPKMWKLFYSMYLLVVAFGFNSVVDLYMDLYYPMVCACHFEFGSYIATLAELVTAGKSEALRCYKMDL